MNAVVRPDTPAATRTHGQSPAQLMLTRLTVAFSRRRAYPPAHPLLVKAEEQAYEALQTALATQRTLSIVVGRNSVLLDDVALDSTHSVARELAERLRLRGVGGVIFDSNASAESLCQAISWLAVEPSASAHATDTRDVPPSLPGIRISRIDYGRLALGDEANGDAMSIDEIWRELAVGLSLEHDIAAANANGEALDPANAAQTNTEQARAALVDGVERRLGDPDAARRAGAVLLRVADQVTRVTGASRAVLAERLQAVLGTLQPSSMRSVIASTGAGAEKRQFIAHMIDALPADAVVDWLQHAAHATGEPLSPQVLHVLSALLVRARVQGQSRDGTTAFRTAARDLVQAWAFNDPAACEHTALLDRISTFDATQLPTEATETGATRLVQLALEIGEFGDDAADATRQLLADGRVADILAWSTSAPGHAAANALRPLLGAPAVVNAVLLRDPLDQALARTLLASLDDSAHELLLDALRDANGRTARRLILARLRECGPSLAPALMTRLHGAPWYFTRNLLALLREISADGHAPEAGADTQRNMTLLRLTEHDHEQVRLEAMRLLLGDPTTRDTAMRRALDDASDRVVLLGLETLAAHEQPGRALQPDVVKRLLLVIESELQSADARARAIRLLAYAPTSPRIRDVLITIATVRTRILRRVVLVDVSNLMLASLEVLATRYAADAQAAPVLDIAGRSDEKRVRDAVARLASLAAIA